MIHIECETGDTQKPEDRYWHEQESGTCFRIRDCNDEYNPMRMVDSHGGYTILEGECQGERYTRVCTEMPITIYEPRNPFVFDKVVN